MVVGGFARCRYGCGPVLSVGKSGRWSFCEVNMRKRLLGFKWPRFSGLSLIYTVNRFEII